MYNKISFEVIYLFVLVNKALSKNFEKAYKELSDFFSLNSIFDIKTYYILRYIFYGSYDLNYLKLVFTDDTVDENTKKCELSKFQKFLSIYVNNKLSGTDKKEIQNKLNKIINILETYKSDDLAYFLYQICNFAASKPNKNMIMIYYALEEYIDLFLDADEIIFNNKLIDKHFKTYFDLLHITPDNICFINKKNNIKIMQNFFPSQIIFKIFSLSGYNSLKKLNKKYFLIEYDKKLVSKQKPELLFHELGHILNLKVYNYQGYVVNMLYQQDTAVNLQILNNWMNEIIADILGNKICENNKFINRFDILPDYKESIKYPSLAFRRAILNENEYDFSSFSEPDIKRTALLIFNNIKAIKEILL